MDWIVASHIALWVGFVLLAVINLALARQVGVLFERIAPAGALMTNSQIQAGQDAPTLQLVSLDGHAIEIGGASDKAQLLFFISPDCPVCGSLTAVFKSAAIAERGWLQSILASDGEELDHRAYAQRHGLEEFPYIVSEALGRSFGVARLPYAVMINEQGKVVSMGIVNSREHLESLFEAKERGVASIQAFLSTQAEPASEPATQR